MSYVNPDYDAPDAVDDDDDDFTAEHVGLVVPPVDQAASRHLKRLVANWGMLADLSFSDLLLYVPLPDSGTPERRFLVVNQVRPNTGQTLFLEDAVGRTMDSLQRPAVAQAAATGDIVEMVVESVWLEEQVRVTAIPVVHHGSVVAVLARESATSMVRQRGVLERVYLEVFERLARMVAVGAFPFEDEEVVATGGPRVGDGVVLLDDQGRVSFASPNAISALRRLGVTGRIQGETLTDVGADTSTTYRAYFTAHPAAEEIERDDVCVVLRCIPLIENRRVDGAVVLVRDVSELRTRDRMLVSKDATIKEIHHRVKNNLQTISSLLRLQGRRLVEPTAKSAIEESVRRIRSIALVHETLSREDGDEVDFGEIARPLVRMVEEGLTSPDRPLEFEIRGDGGKLPSPAATALAVVLTELLQNVVDHAYPPGTLGVDEHGEAEHAHVGITLSHAGGTLRLVVTDNGVGTGDGFDPETTDSLGLSIVRGLIDELGGTITFGPASSEPSVPGRTGSRVDLTVPLVATIEPDAERPPGVGGRSVGL